MINGYSFIKYNYKTFIKLIIFNDTTISIIIEIVERISIDTNNTKYNQ